MLDFYLNKAGLNLIPDKPDEVNYIASINMTQHQMISNFFKQIVKVVIRFPFFEDFIWTREEVKILFNYFNNYYLPPSTKKNEKESFSLFLKILTSAKNNQAGIYAFCD